MHVRRAGGLTPVKQDIVVCCLKLGVAKASRLVQWSQGGHDEILESLSGKSLISCDNYLLAANHLSELGVGIYGRASNDVLGADLQLAILQCGYNYSWNGSTMVLSRGGF